MTTARDRPPEEAAEDTSFARGLRVLLTVADRGEMRADELSSLLDTPVSTIYRYLRTLQSFGFVDRQGAGYRLGPQLIIGQGTNITAEELRRTSDPVLRLLADETGETAVIVRRVGLTAVCLHQAESRNPLRVSIGPDTSLPLDRGAFGKALLAFAPAEIIDEVLAAGDGTSGSTGGGGASGQTGRRATRAGGRLRRELAEIVSDGIARSTDELVGSSVSIAVPVFRADGIVAAIGVIGPASRCGAAWQKRVERLLAAAASSIVGALRPAAAE